MLWSCQGAGVVVLGRSPPAGLRCDLVGSSRVAWLARLRPRPSPRLPARRPPASTVVTVRGPGPSRAPAPPWAPRPAGCSLRARPRPTRPPTGTSPSSPRRTRKVRVGPTGLRSRGGRVGTPAPVPAGPSPETANDSGGCGAQAPPLGHPLRRRAG